MLSSRSRRAGVLTLAALPLALTHALAQTPDGADAPATLDAVMVTANKRVENVQEVPKQVMVVTPDTLSKSGVTTIAELGNAIPSIGGAVPSEQRASAPPIRGISSFSISIGVQTQTGIVIDDVPQASYSSLFKELTDIQSVEVLAGPQSTLSGRNASGGLINIVTREPSLEYFAAEASIEQTSDRQERFSAFLSGPLSDTLAFSLSAFSNEWEGHQRSLSETNGNRPLHIGGWDTQGARGKLRWQPNERLNATLIGWWMESSSRATDPVSDGYFAVDPNAAHSRDTSGRSFADLYPGLELKRYNRWVVSERHSTFNTKDRGGSLKVEYDLPNAATLTSVTSVSRADLPRDINQLTIPFDQWTDPVITGVWGTAGYETETKTQEFRLASPSGQTVDYVLGLAWSDTDTWHPYTRLGIFPVRFIRTFDIESMALFGRGTYHIGERDALTAGLRYQRDDMGYSFASTLIPPQGSIVPFSSEGRSKYDFISGELSWRHQFADTVNGYVTLSRAQSGEVYDLEDFDGARSAQGLQPLDSQKVKNIEIGMKSQFLDRRLTLNVNAFLARYDNFHIQFAEAPLSSNDAPVILLLPIGKVETRGLEFDARLRATENLSLNFSGAWIDAKIKDYPNGACWAGDRQRVDQGCIRNPLNPADAGFQTNLAGNRMPNAPEFKLFAAANYFVPLDSLPFDLELGTSWRWQSETWFDYRGNPNLVEGSYGVLNLSATLLDREGRYSLDFFINNLLDKNFYNRMGDDANWRAPASGGQRFGGHAYFGGFARDSFRYSGVRLKVNF